MWRRQAALALNGTAGVQASGRGRCPTPPSSRRQPADPCNKVADCVKTHSSAATDLHPTSNSSAPTSLVRDLEQMATSLAMHCVGVVTLQRALCAGKEHLRRPEDRLCQSRQNTDTRDHDED